MLVHKVFYSPTVKPASLRLLSLVPFEFLRTVLIGPTLPVPLFSPCTSHGLIRETIDFPVSCLNQKMLAS